VFVTKPFFSPVCSSQREKKETSSSKDEKTLENQGQAEKRDIYNKQFMLSKENDSMEN